jgi:hypothetical protein
MGRSFCFTERKKTKKKNTGNNVMEWHYCNSMLYPPNVYSPCFSRIMDANIAEKNIKNKISSMILTLSTYRDVS